MGIRSKVAVLPAAVRDELDRLIVERAFSGYQALAEWLQGQGYRISDDSVQRYGVRVRQQLESIKLASHQARAFAAAGKGVRDTANDLVAINAQQILQQTLGILLQGPEPCASSGRSNKTAVTGAAAYGNPGDPDVPITESGEKSAPVPVEPNKLDVRDLIELTHISVELSRTMKDQPKRAEQLNDQPNAEQLKEQAHQPRPSMPRARALKLRLAGRSLPLARSFAGEGAGEGSALTLSGSSSAATKTARELLLSQSNEPPKPRAHLKPSPAHLKPSQTHLQPSQTQLNPLSRSSPHLTALTRIRPSIESPSNPSPNRSGPLSCSPSWWDFPRLQARALSPDPHSQPMINPQTSNPIGPGPNQRKSIINVLGKEWLSFSSIPTSGTARLNRINVHETDAASRTSTSTQSGFGAPATVTASKGII
jgi:hypothetical protein